MTMRCGSSWSPGGFAPSAPAWTRPAAGNVFGLDENQQPTIADMTERRLRISRDDRRRQDTGGRVTLAIYDCKKPAGRCHQRGRGERGATMTCAMTHPPGLGACPYRFRIQQDRHHPEACSTSFLRIVGMSRA